MLLKFWTGRNRLVQGVKIFYSIITHYSKDRLPEGHTCGWAIDVPNYSSYEKMVKSFKIAIELCGEIDNDGGYYGNVEGLDDHLDRQ